MSSDHHFDAPEIEELAKLLPAYDITSFIAKGGMGAVYRASQRSLDREVAIKILPKEFGEDAEFRKQFESEAKAMAKLNHPNLVGVHDFGEVEGMLYIVMEYVPGKPLYYSAYQTAVEQKEAGRLVLEICEGLGHAHDAGILHRDIKPANILLDLKARPKIGDFGLASHAEAEDSDELAFGTPGYAAPELMQDGGSVSKGSDVFATGVILYELLTGELPDDAYVPVSQRGEIDPRFDVIIRRATHPDPSLRFADAGEMAAELRALLGSPKALAADGNPSSKPAASDETPVVEALKGANFALIRNLVIIALLLLAIWGMWGAYEKRTASNVQKQKDFEKQQLVKKQEEEERLASLHGTPNKPDKVDKPEPVAGGTAGNTPTAPRPVPPAPPKPKSPLEVLEELKDGLAGGDRSKFPPGTEERGSNRFFYVNTPMNWQQAATFAEEHGGHLATCPTIPDGNWLSSKIKDDATIWIGGGAIGRSEWGWIDASEWTHRKPSVVSGTSAAINPMGTIKARPPGEELTFFIQWHMDGGNPGSLDSQLTRTRETLASPDPTFPPGTFVLEERRYFLVTRSITWTEARDFAQQVEGDLAVPSDPAESDFLKSVVDKSIPGGKACWLGGQHNGETWVWTTGEPWASAAWAEGSPNGEAQAACALRLVAGPAGGWDDEEPANDDATVALLIEWSKDSEKKDKVEIPTASGELARLRKKGAGAVKVKGDDYRKKLKENAKAFNWELHQFLRGLAEGPKASYTPSIDNMKESVRDDGSIPGDISRAGMPGKAAKILDVYLDTQDRIHSKYMIDLNRLRISYIGLLKEARTPLEERGLKAQVQAIDNEISACGSDASIFLEHFTGKKHVAPAG